MRDDQRPHGVFGGDAARVPDNVRFTGLQTEKRFHDEAAGAVLAVEAARRGLLFKRSTYNFVSWAHDEAAIDEIVAAARASLEETR